MTTRLRLINSDGTEALDLLGGPIRVMNWGWDTQPTSLQQRLISLPFGIQANSLGYPQVVETLSLATFGCDDDIRAEVRRLEEFLENAKAYMDDPVDGDAHWLEWHTDGEPDKRALVVGGTWQWHSRPPSAWPMLGGKKLLLKLALTRHPLWERSTAATPNQDDTVNSVGGTVAYLATAGRVPARVHSTRIYNVDNSTHTTPITTVWMGFRPEYHGLTAFDPVWECEDGTADINTAAANVAGCSGPGANTAMVTTYADEDLDRRLYISVQDVLGVGTPWANARHFAGRYLVLCRCYLTGTDPEATVQMRYGYLDGEMTSFDPIALTNTAALYLELGEIQIPTPGISNILTTTANIDYACALSTIEIWSQRQNTTTTTMTVDVLVLIPSDHFLKIDSATIGTHALGNHGDQWTAYVLREPDERLFGIQTYLDNTGAYDNPWNSSIEVSSNQWYLPIGNSRLVAAAQRAASQVITDDMSVTCTWYPRWTSYRE